MRRTRLVPLLAAPVLAAPLLAAPVLAAPVLAAAPPVAAAGPATKLLVIVEENRTYAAAVAGMPYLMSLARRYGYATRYAAVANPSLPNYLAIAGGSTFGVTDDAGPAAHPISGPSVFGQALAAGKTAKAYLQSMTANCQQSSPGPYAVKHNPWAYFVQERAQCQAYDVPAGTPSAGPLRNDVVAGTLPNAGMFVPDVLNDAHDGSLAQADAYLRAWLPVIMGGPDFRSGRLKIVVTFDEGNRSNNGVLTVVIDPALAGAVLSTPYNHYSLTRLYDEVLGTPLLRGAASANSMQTAAPCWAGPAVVRDNVWYLAAGYRQGAAVRSFGYGRPGDRPVIGKWDAASAASAVGVVRGAIWYLRRSQSGGPAELSFNFGRPGDLPVVGDWNGDGSYTPGVVRGNTWYLRNSNTGGVADVTFAFSAAGTPTTVYDPALGRTLPATYAGGRWSVRRTLTSGGPTSTASFGRAGDLPVGGGPLAANPTCGTASLGLVRGNVWFLGPPRPRTVSFSFGRPGDIFLTQRYAGR